MKRFALLILSALLIGAAAAPAEATVLPDAVSYEYFGIGYASAIVTSNTVGTLDYSGQQGCRWYLQRNNATPQQFAECF